MKEIIICDLDGTIANNNHRTHYVKHKPKNWKAYNELMVYDTPIWPVIDVIKLLSNYSNVTIVFCSGREETYRKVTENWLVNTAKFSLLDIHLYMRPEKDYRKDDDVKEMLYHQILKDFDDAKVTMVFDDRPQVVRRWRELGLFVFDVNQSGEEF